MTSSMGEEWDRLPDHMKEEFKKWSDSWYAGWSSKGRHGFLQALAMAFERGQSVRPEGRDSIIEECARVCNQSFFINGREVGTTPVHHLIQDAIRDLKGKSMNSQR